LVGGKKPAEKKKKPYQCRGTQKKKKTTQVDEKGDRKPIQAPRLERRNHSRGMISRKRKIGKLKKKFGDHPIKSARKLQVGDQPVYGEKEKPNENSNPRKEERREEDARTWGG